MTTAQRPKRIASPVHAFTFVELLTVIAIIGILLGPSLALGQSENTLGPVPLNGGFEDAAPVWQSGIQDSTPGVNAAFVLVGDVVHSGRHAARLSADAPGRFSIVPGRQRVTTAAGERFRVSLWVKGGPGTSISQRLPGPVLRLTLRDAKAQNVAAGHFALGLGGVKLGNTLDTNPRNIPVPSEWTKLEAVVEMPAGISWFMPELFSWGVTGPVWFDDLSIERVPSDTALTPLLASAPSSSALPVLIPARIDEIAAWVSATPALFTPPFNDRAWWEARRSLPDAPALLARAERFAAKPVPALTEEMYFEYMHTGLRPSFEVPYIERTFRLSTFTLAEGLRGDGLYLPRIESELDAILSTPGWAVPAHTWSRHTKKGTSYDASRDPRNAKEGTTWADSRDYVDLAAASTAWTLAITDWLLGDRLSPATRARLRIEVRERVLDPYIACVRGGDLSGKARLDFWWIIGDHNWNAVCNAGVLGAALLILDDPRDRAEFIAAYETFTRSYLDGFTADGFCFEGIGYWLYGFGNFCAGAEAIREATGGRLDLLASPRAAAIARFPQNWQLIPGDRPVYPAFGDANDREPPMSWLFDLLAIRLDAGSTNPAPFLDIHPRALGHQLFGVLLGLSQFDSVNPPAAPRPPAALAPRNYFPDGGALVSRGSRLSAAFKGGRNNRSHGHNDAGSIYLTLDGKYILGDLGSDEYTAKSSGPDRYISDLLNSRGHPVPIVAGQLQKNDGRALSMSTEFTPERDIWELDLTPAYDAPSLKKLTRTFIFTRADGGRLEIIDRATFSTPQTFGNALVFRPGGQWNAAGENTFRVQNKDGGAVIVSFSTPGNELRFNESPVRGIRYPEKPAKGSRLGFDLVRASTEAVIRTVIAPVL